MSKLLEYQILLDLPSIPSDIEVDVSTANPSIHNNSLNWKLTPNNVHLTPKLETFFESGFNRIINKFLDSTILDNDLLVLNINEVILKFSFKH
jgi:hypothetical protein